MKADEVYAVLNGRIQKISEAVGELENTYPIVFKGDVLDEESLPESPKTGDMYNIDSKSQYGEAGQKVAWTGTRWDPMSPIIDMSLYLSKEDAQKTYQPKGEYLIEVPEATEEKYGGIKARKKTTESVEVSIDPNSGKAFVPQFPEGLARNDTAEMILAKLNEIAPYLQQIAENSENAAGLNGFSFMLNEDDSVQMTYHNPLSGELEDSKTLPTDTTLEKILQSSKEIAENLKIIQEGTTV